ncbi:MAG: peptidase domain-containing ABC transporter [Chthoniobacterales bacterium]
MPEIASLSELLIGASIFNDLPEKDLVKALRGKVEEVLFETGQELIPQGKLPDSIFLIREGTARLLGAAEEPVSLELLKTGSLVGWFSLANTVPCEWVRASAPLKALRIPADVFEKLLRDHPAWASSLRSRTSLSELFPLIRNLLKERGLPLAATKQIVIELLPQAMVADSPTHSSELTTPNPDPLSAIPDSPSPITQLRSSNGRVIGVPTDLLTALLGTLLSSVSSLPVLASASDTQVSSFKPQVSQESSPSSSDTQVSAFTFHPSSTTPPPFHKASRAEEAVLACLKMLAGQLDLPFREEMIRSALNFQFEGREGAPALSFHRIGSVADMIGIATQPLQLPLQALRDQDAPFLMILGDRPVVVQGVSPHGLLIADPIAKDKADQQKWIDWKELPEPGEQGYPILLSRRSRSPKGEEFGFRSFLPYIRKHTRTFVEVVIASLFIQVFALANPMIIQVIIDKVIVQESLSTLDVLGGLLIICTIFGAALTAIRTFLFTDATNRIDLALGLKVLEHLYRLPLSYFHQRPVGEIASRLRELEKIRSFLTGTALTALLDAGFSVIYVAIMLFYSVELTVIALIGVPLLVAVTLGVSPVIRRQLKDRAEKNAATESHLVESLTGIQTIKGQNIETRSRWKWFKRYGDTIASSFRNTITSTSASTVGTLISRFNDVAVLWVGIYMVIDQKLSLGQLIAFRILAGYVTSPLLRLAQSWQNFQEAALSMNRLGDVANRAREDQDSDDQIPMPGIEGRVTCKDLDFSYAPGKLQLEHVSLEVPAGKLVAMVGLSGSGKSTLLKIIGRLYEPVKGKVEIDGFDLSKVELNSLRRQIGMVFQETLLMEGSVMDNIAMSDPDAPSSAVIEAAKLAEAHDFIMTLPNGYASPVGEQGRNLSGGQRQRIALARLIMQSPNLLLLDEATSALDAPTEQRVITNLRQKFSGKTIFFATHRLSTVRMADHVYYLENGLLKESGTPAELMDKKGLYYALSLQQEAAA